jgi:dipeptidyl aminopeptidase/acylaminoacyl peptidase
LIAVAIAGVDAPPEICTVDAVSAEVKCLYKDARVGATSPTWSPDGKRIMFVCDRDLCVMNADGSAMTRITHNEGQQRPTWSPDGGAIAFMSYDGTKSRIATMAPDGSNMQVLTPENKGGGHDDSHPAWSPDGKFILFSSDRNDKQEIYMMQRDGSGMRRVYSHNVYGLLAPVGSPDGRLAFDALSPARIGPVANNDQFWPAYMRHPTFPKSLFGWQRECFVLSADGKEVHHLFPDQCGFIAFQPVGKAK